jgi:hypothetical protein
MINCQVLVQKLLEISCASISFSLLLLLCQKAKKKNGDDDDDDDDDDMIPHASSISDHYFELLDVIVLSVTNPVERYQVQCRQVKLEYGNHSYSILKIDHQSRVQTAGQRTACAIF